MNNCVKCFFSIGVDPAMYGITDIKEKVKICTHPAIARKIPGIDDRALNETDEPVIDCPYKWFVTYKGKKDDT